MRQDEIIIIVLLIFGILFSLTSIVCTIILFVQKWRGKWQ